MKFRIAGGSWIDSNSWGFLGQSGGPELDSGLPVDVPVKEFFDEPLRRYGRFDSYTKLGFAGAGLALKDCGFSVTGLKYSAGIVVSTLCGSFDNDLEYYRTTLEDGGQLASPNLFSYTLPGIVLGECAVNYNLSGPALCVGADAASPGIEALKLACLMLESGQADIMLAGYLESSRACPLKTALNGAVFVVLMRADDDTGTISFRSDGVFSADASRIDSLLDIFKARSR